MKCFYNKYFSKIRLAIAFAGALLVCSFQAQAAIVLGATTTGLMNNSNTATISHTTASGSNRLMIVGVSAQQPGASITSMTYNGTSLTKLVRVTNASQTRVEIWYLVAPAVGTFNVVVNNSGGENAIIGVQTYSGVDQTTPFGTYVSASSISGTTATVNASSASGELVYGVVGWNNGNANTIGAGQTEYWDLPMNSSIAGAGSTEAGAATVTMSWTNAGSQPWTIVAVPLKPVTTAQSSVSVRVNQGTDDAEEEGPTGVYNGPGGMYLVSSDLELVSDTEAPSTGTQKVGMRFNSLSVPTGANINSAYITFRAVAADGPNSNSGATTLTIRGQAADNATTFITTDYDITNRTTTSASATWSPGTWTTGTNYNTVDISSIVQEIVDRAGWASGNSMVIIITGSGSRSTYAYEGSPSTAPQLNISFDSPTPGGASGLRTWFKTDAGTSLTGSTLTTWTNQNTGNSSISNVTGSSGNTFTSGDGISYLPSVAFSGATPPSLSHATTGSANNFMSQTNGSIYSVLIDNTIGSANYAFGWGINIGANPTPELSFLRDGIVIDPTSTTNTINDQWIGNGGTFGTEPAVLTAKFSINATADDRCYFNGKSGTAVNLGNESFANGRLYIGGHVDGFSNYGFNGTIGEILSYNVSHSDADRNKIESYLAAKWGVTLDQTSATNYTSSVGTVFWNATTNATYKNRITVIGRDDLSLLNKKQSKSVHSGLKVNLGLGTIAASNAANANTFSANISFLAFGDDNGSVAAWSETGAPANRQIVARTWIVQETGTVGSVKVQVPDNSGTNGLPAETNTVYLLVDADDDFDDGATEIAMTLNGTNWEANVDLTTGQFFTFATRTPNAPGGVTSNLSLWLKADAGTSSTSEGGTVSTWNDQSGGGNNATTTNNAGWTSPGVNPPLYRTGISTLGVNFNPSVDFTGDKTLDGAAGLSPKQVFTVFKNMTSGKVAIGFDDVNGGGGGAQSTLYYWANQIQYYARNNSNNNYFKGLINSSIPGVQPFIFDGQHITNATGSLLVNGGGSTTVGNLGTPPAPFTGAYRLNKTSDNQYPGNGQISEVVSYNGNLSATDRQKVSTYLAVKYGITLSHNYLNSAATTVYDIATYGNNVAGIGRDDNSVLNQKQSRSVNTASGGNLVTVGLGTIAANNISNTNTFSADKNFLVWGDNNGSTAVQNTDNPDGTCGRMTRIWKAQETGGEVGNVAVNFDLSALSAAYGGYAVDGLYLVVSSSTSFATPLRSYTATSYTAGIAAFTGVDLDNGEYFTLAVKDMGFTPAVNSNSPVCAESALSLTANGGTTYLWSGPNGFTSSLQNPLNSSAQFLDAGTYSVTITNGFGCRDLMTTTVLLQNCSPTVCVQTICNTDTATGSITATDEDGDVLTYTLTQNPSFGTVSIVGNNYTYTPNAGFVGEDQIIIQTCDPSNACVFCLKKFIVEACNIPPVCGTTNSLRTCMGTAASATLNATSPNGLPITYSIVSQPSSGIIGLVGSTYTYTPVQGFEGSVTWVYRATTATGSVDCTVTIYVENCFSDCDGNGCAANQMSGGSYPNSGSTLYSKINEGVSSNTNYCYSITLTNQCAACPPTATVSFYAGTILLGTINYNELPLNLACVKGFSFNTAQLGNPGNINFTVTHAGFGTPGTTIVAANASLKTITGGGSPEANNDEGISICKNSGLYTAAVLSNDINVSTTPTLTLITSLPGATGTASVVGQNVVFTPNASFVGTVNLTYQICNGMCCDQAVLTIVVTDPAVSVAPATVCLNSSTSIFATVTGIDTSFVAYQWQSSADNISFADLVGATASNYLPPSAALGTTYYRVVISVSSRGCNSVTSSSAAVVVVADPSITAQPTGFTECVGGTQALSVTATGGTPSLTYQWQSSPDNATFSNIGGATASSYTPPAAAAGTTYYRVVVSASGGGCGSVTSGSVPVVIVADPAISAQPTGFTECVGGTQALSVTATGGTPSLTYQWQSSPDNLTFSNIGGATASSYTLPSAAAGTTYYRVVVSASGGGCGSVTSGSATVVIVADPAITAQPASATICPGGTQTLSVTTTGGSPSLTYQWQSSPDNVTFANIGGATLSSYTTPALFATTYYRVVISASGNGCGSATSNTATVTISSGFANAGADVTICAGSLTTLTASGGATYNWSNGLGAGASKNVSPASTTTYTVTVTTGLGCTATDQVTITVIACPEICDNGLDDDNDGLTDCADPDCAGPAITSVAKTNPNNCPALNNGTITITATGSNLEYSINGGATYQASNVFSGLSEGNYNVRVRNGVTGCFVNYPSNPVVLTAVICAENCTNGTDDDGDGLIDCLDGDCVPNPDVGTNVNICIGASYVLNATATSGTSPYTFNWDNGLGAGQTHTVTPLVTTTYQVTVTSASGCTATDGLTITVTTCPEDCTDVVDNDGDGLVDCADPDCQLVGAPLLANDVYETCPGAVFQEQPIFNDNNLQNPLYSIFAGATKGTVTINYQGVFTYTPTLAVCGVDSFKYQVCNALYGCCDQATVVLNIGDSDPPELKNVPADLTISCNDPVPSAPLVFGVDDCPGIYMSFDEVNSQVNAGSCQFYTIVRTWTATDKCGNASSASQTITVKDTEVPEIFRVYTLANGKKLVAGTTPKGTTSWQTVKFPISFNATPLVFSQVVTTNSPEAVITRHRNINLEGFELKIQEEEAGDGVHASEQVAWLAMEQGALGGSSNLQAGQLTNVTQALKLLTYSTPFSSPPVIIASPQTYVEFDPFQVRYTNSTATSTQLYLEEEKSLDGEVTHGNERVAYLASKLGEIQDENGDFVALAGAGSFTDSWKTITFGKKLTKPIVIFGGQPIGNDPATVRVRNVTSTSFEARIDEWEYLNGTTTARTLYFFVVEGSIPALAVNPCSLVSSPLIPGLNLFAVDNCDNQVSMDYTESSQLTPIGLITTQIWISADDCGNESTLIRNDTCKLAAVRIRATLAGAMIGNGTNAPLMRDNLRTKGYVPFGSPYVIDNDNNPVGTPQGTNEVLDPPTMDVTGDNAVVDWVLIELRDPIMPETIRANFSGVLQRDGDVVIVNGSDILSVPGLIEGLYLVRIKHRNHLGMMTEQPVYLKLGDVPLVDFNLNNTLLFSGTEGGKLQNGKKMLWPGDFNNDNKIIYQGPNNDVFKLFSDVLTHPLNTTNLANFIRAGYEDSDINMDGNAIFQGPGNDRSLLLLHTVLSHPANSLLLANFIATEILP